ncbi:hypothetical protein AWB71_05257 [Caballeronia peredens]|nr:hypothetical protein AWB71_05257 [Caballeronia peredens]
MDLQSNGYNYIVLEDLRNKLLFDLTREDYIQDKKYQARYHLNRWKTSSSNRRDKRLGFNNVGYNNECMRLRFDTNLSPDFSKTHIDIATQRSLSVYLDEVNQPEFGRTQLVLRIEHVDGEQNLYQNRSWQYIETLPGTVAKRMKLYKDEFERLSEEFITTYLQDGFKVVLSHITDNMASYLFHAYFRGTAWCNYDIATPINNMLLVFSVLNDDCLTYGRKTVDEWNAFTDYERLKSYHPVVIPPEQQDRLDTIFRFYRERYKEFNSIVEGSMVKEGLGRKIHLAKLKELVQQSPLCTTA